jgi:LytR cell envelope-related transcriptional attenuator
MRPVDYPVQRNRWRTRALVLAAIAALELLVLLGLGVLAAGHVLASEVETVAREHQLAPTKRKPPSASADRELLARNQTSVVVLNANGVSGAAASSAACVKGLTYVVAKVGNAPRMFGRTIVMYRKNHKLEAHRLAKDLGVRRIGPLDGLREPDLMGAHLALVLGR